jgi:hypothetical protein
MSILLVLDFMDYSLSCFRKDTQGVRKEHIAKTWVQALL